MSSKPLIVAATQQEINPCIPLLDQHKIPYLITGVGMVATAYSLTKELQKNTPSIVINVGIAGSFSRDLAIGTVIQVVKDTFSELGAEDHLTFLSLEDLGLGISTWTDGNKLETNLHQVAGITVNTVHGELHAIARIKTLFPEATTESMEGAAVAFVCEQEHTPYLQVRSISNYVEPRDRSTWNIPLAVQNLNEWIVNYLKI